MIFSTMFNTMYINYKNITFSYSCKSNSMKINIFKVEKISILIFKLILGQQVYHSQTNLVNLNI